MKIVAAEGQPAFLNPRRKINYWLLLVQCLERVGDYDGAIDALREAISWKCTPLTRIYESIDRMEKKKLLLIAKTPVKHFIVHEPVQSTTNIHDYSVVESPEDINNLADKYKYICNETLKTPQRLIIQDAAKLIQSAKSAPASVLRTNEQDRGSRLVLTPLRASKRIQDGILFF